MNRDHRGPVLLTAAGVFVLFSLVAYLIGDAERNRERYEESCRHGQLLRAQNERSIADRARLHEQNERSVADRAELRRRQDAADKELRRLETSSLKPLETLGAECDQARRDLNEQRIHVQRLLLDQADIRRRQESIEETLRRIEGTLKSGPVRVGDR